jgi:hypothetical protein
MNPLGRILKAAWMSREPSGDLGLSRSKVHFDAITTRLSKPRTIPLQDGSASPRYKAPEHFRGMFKEVTKVTTGLFLAALSLMLAFTNTGRAEKMGFDFISSGAGLQIEGTLRRVAYAPPTTNSLVFEGSWKAVLGEGGVYISATYNKKKSEVAIIGSDQFELLTVEGGRQRGTIQAADHFFVGGENQIVSQFIFKRVYAAGRYLTLSNGPSSWYHIVTALKADTIDGVSMSQSIDKSQLIESWFVSRYLEQGKVPEYFSNGFLAVKYQGNMGSVAPGETIEVQEYWPKEHPVGERDVDLFRDTTIKVSSVIRVTNVNLLPLLTYKEATIEDLRFGGSANPLGLTVSQASWIPKESANWGKLQAIAEVVLNDPRNLASRDIGWRKNVIRYIVLSVIASISVIAGSTILYRFFHKTPKQTKQ